MLKLLLASLSFIRISRY